MTILVAADFDDAEWARWWPLLQAAFARDTLVRAGASLRAQDVDVAVVANPPPGSLAGLPNLRLIQSLWAGVDRLLGDVTIAPDVALARMVDPLMNEAMAQTALWAVLSLHRGFFRYVAAQRRAQWLPEPACRADEVEVAVLGLGQMGQAVARRLSASGYRVCGWRRLPVEVAGLPGVAQCSGLPALDPMLARAHVVVNLLPLTPDTEGLFDAGRFARMRRGAGFVHLGRGAQVVEADLLDALDRARLGHAVLDVYATEPLPAAHPFWSHPAITVLPHVAAPTDPRSAVAIAAHNVAAWRAGEPLRDQVDRTRGY